jgi:hypothetical protein
VLTNGSRFVVETKSDVTGGIEMKWYTLQIYYGIEPFETLIKANSEDEAFKKARERWGNDVIIKFS